MTSLHNYCIETNCQHILSQWDSDLNHPLSPKDVTPGSNRKVWWRCDKGHAYESSVHDHVKRGRGCPFCTGNTVLPGFNDLATRHPGLASQWHPALNNDLTPASITYASRRKVWWRCEHGHAYECEVEKRFSRNVGCPYCSGRRVLSGFNDLATTHPHIAIQWHKSLNKDLTPDAVTSGTDKKVWWSCENGHEWEASIVSRTRENGTNCPYCIGRKLLPGTNDLASTHPHLIAQWNHTRNKGLSPAEIHSGSEQKIWWICEKGHEWRSNISTRTAGADCPVCKNRSVLKGDNDLCTTHPDIAAQWDSQKNGSIRPEHVVAGSNNKAWWLCEKGHSYEATIRSRALLETKCPYCTGRRVLPGFNDLATIHPLIAVQWHKTLNEGLTPDQVTSGCKKKVWWQCSEGHVWKAVVYSRTGPEKCGCPVCGGKINKKRAERYKAMLAEVGLEARAEDDFIPKEIPTL